MQLPIVLLFLVVIPPISSVKCPLQLCSCGQSNHDPSKRDIDCRDSTSTDLSVIVNITSPSTELFYEFTLSNIGITSIGKNAFEGLRFAKLELTGNTIANIDREAFAGLEAYLEVIYIEGNGQFALPLEAMKNMSKLTEISFKNFKQGTINSSTGFEYFPSVQKLTLINAHIAFMLSSSFTGKLLKIKHLTITHNPILSEFPAPAIAKLRTLTHLIWNYNDMREVRRHAFAQLTNLQELDLQNNRIDIFENNSYDGITDNLEILNLHYNSITDISIQSLAIPNWPMLRQLNLGYNKLQNLPPRIFSKMTGLKNLRLSQNNIQELKKDAFTGMHSLLSLELNENNISTMEREVLADLPFLHTVKLESQQIGLLALNFTRGSMIGAESIRKLVLQNTRVVETEFWNAIRELKNLTSLNVGHTRIKNIPNRIFTDLNNLSILDLSSNNISGVTQDSFLGLAGSLTSLNLKDNFISQIDSCVLHGFNKLTQI